MTKFDVTVDGARDARSPRGARRRARRDATVRATTRWTLYDFMGPRDEGANVTSLSDARDSSPVADVRDVVRSSDDDVFAVDGDHAEPGALGLFHVLRRRVRNVDFAARSHFRMKARDVGGELDVVV